ncbi:hypothetical protein GcC1_013010 [Golovinomyces cichoracearum]|uniref:Uncharacterized protein n=1 Tax=Golovinomyces cichoracearum TaxID=62708 RepID=A0A420J743_9PEZI|nr:hypothetical protein GcC1_013010 [Golovinomyces cichoracearum]
MPTDLRNIPILERTDHRQGSTIDADFRQKRSINEPPEEPPEVAV